MIKHYFRVNYYNYTVKNIYEKKLGDNNIINTSLSEKLNFFTKYTSEKIKT